MISENFTFAIDISQHNLIKWEEVPDWIQVVGIKATEGIGWTDPKFEEHTENALESGKLVILYHFYRTFVGSVKSDPVAQAQWFAERTKQYWPDCGGRGNDAERGPMLSNGVRYNPPIPTIKTDLEDFHKTLHESAWNAFDLIYTGMGTWAEWGLQNADLYRGPQWIKNQPYVDGLWLAWYPYNRPHTEAQIPAFLDALPVPGSKYTPKPFTEYITWQIAADFQLPGSYSPTTGLAKGIDLDLIPYPFEEVQKLFGAYPQPEEPEEPVEPGDGLVLEVLQEIAGHQASMASSLAIIASQTQQPGGGGSDDGGDTGGGDPGGGDSGSQDPQFKRVRVKRPKPDAPTPRVYLSHITGENKGNPEKGIPPKPVINWVGESQQIHDDKGYHRVIVTEGDILEVYADGYTEADGGRNAWRLNMAQNFPLTGESGPISLANDNQLYIEVAQIAAFID